MTVLAWWPLWAGIILHHAELPLLQQEMMAPAAKDTLLPPKMIRDTPWQITLHGRAQRMAIGRFWGIGPHSSWRRQSSYSRAHAALDLTLTRPLPFLHGKQTSLQLGLLAHYDALYGSMVASLPSAALLHPNAPSVAGGGYRTHLRFGLRYDGIHAHAHRKKGGWLEASVSVAWPLPLGEPLWLVHVDGRKLLTHPKGLTTALRFYGRFVNSAKAPFYLQSHLGGSHALRGHNDGRFVDQGAWSLELEERVHLYTSNFFGHTLRWHLDPYVGVGQVFHQFSPEHLFVAPRPVLGFGLRTIIHPHMVTRWDIATDFSRLRGTFGLGYPF